MKRNWFFPLLVLLAAVFVAAWLRPPQTVVPDSQVKEAGTFDECVAEGNPIAESYPPTCRTKSGKVLTQNIGNEQTLSYLITIQTPRPHETVTSPIKIHGEARGSWFFEAQFTATLLDEDGGILGRGIMTAEGEWMTEEFVPYSGEIVFEKPDGEKGRLILEKSNPSGIPEKDSQLIVPVRF
jgi:hypothetical protein